MTLYSSALGVAIRQACYATDEEHERPVLLQLQEQGSGSHLTVKANQLDTLHRQSPANVTEAARSLL